ncbi:MAG: hypothetical protein K9K86_09865 [Pseudomonadales bacterium]|nr:hypothetical protein [Pseudomonadales bacterium]
MHRENVLHRYFVVRHAKKISLLEESFSGSALYNNLKTFPASVKSAIKKIGIDPKNFDEIARKDPHVVAAVVFVHGGDAIADIEREFLLSKSFLDLIDLISHACLEKPIGDIDPRHTMARNKKALDLESEESVGEAKTTTGS